MKDPITKSYGGRQPPSRKNFQNREKTFIIERNLSESRKKFWNPEKQNYEIEKKITESRKKISKSRKIFRNREKNFRIEKTVSELRSIMLPESRKNLWN